MYKKQIESHGNLGFATLKPLPLSVVHPTKHQKIQKLFFPSTTSSHNASISKLDCESESEDASSYFESLTSEEDEHSNVTNKSKTTKRSKTFHATKMVVRHSLYTHKALNLFSTLSDEGIALPTPSQSGV